MRMWRLSSSCSHGSFSATWLAQDGGLHACHALHARCAEVIGSACAGKEQLLDFFQKKKILGAAAGRSSWKMLTSTWARAASRSMRHMAVERRLFVSPIAAPSALRAMSSGDFGKDACLGDVSFVLVRSCTIRWECLMRHRMRHCIELQCCEFVMASCLIPVW